MVPVIHVWIVQWYWYVPGVVRVIVNELPAARLESLIEDSETPEGALVNVTVWSVLSLFTNLTIVPAATLRLCGLKVCAWLEPVPLGIDTVTVPVELDELDGFPEPIPEYR